MTPVAVGTVMREGLWSSLMAAALGDAPTELSPEMRVTASYSECEQAALELPEKDLDVVLIAAERTDASAELQLAASLRMRTPRLPLVLLVRSFHLELPPDDVERLSVGCSILNLESVSTLATVRQALVSAASGYQVMDPRLRITPRIEPASPVLCPYERRLLKLLQEGYTNDAIARRVHLSPRTVESQIRSLYVKLKIETGDPELSPRVMALASE